MPRSNGTPEKDRGLPKGDYVSPGLAIIFPDAAFPQMIAGDVSVPQWPYLRRWVPHNWYTDSRKPDTGFVSRDEAAILYNSALLFKGANCLEIGCWRGWSSVHLALGCGSLDIIDPLFDDPNVVRIVASSCKAAGVIDNVRFHAGFSPAALDDLSRESGKRWSLIFIDGDHEGAAPRLDAEAAIRNAAESALVLFHDLVAPDVAAGLDVMRNAGWRTMIYQTTQIMGVAWRGNVEPVAHVPDPEVFWTLPRHLAGYEVSGWKRSTYPLASKPVSDPSMAAQWAPAMLRAQAAEDDREAVSNLLKAAEAKCSDSVRRAESAESELEAMSLRLQGVEGERREAVLQAKVAEQQREGAALQLSDAASARDAALMQASDAASSRDALSARLEEAEAERAAATGRAEGAERQREAAVLQLSKAESACDAASKQALDAAGSRDAMSARLEDVEAKRAAATERAEAAERQREAAVLQLSEAETARQAALMQASDAAGSRDAFSARLEEAEAERAAATRRAEDAERQREAAVLQLSEAETERNAALMQASDAAGSRDAFSARLEEAEAERAAATRRAEGAERQREAVVLRLSKAEAARHAASKQASDAAGSRDVMAARLEKVEAERDAAATVAKDANTDLHAMARRLEEAEAERAAALLQAQAADADRSVAIAQIKDTQVTRDAALLRAQAAEHDRVSAVVRTQRVEAELITVKAADRRYAIDRLVRWSVRKRILLELLRRSPAERIALVRAEAAAFSPADAVSQPFFHWLCRRRTLLELLWCAPDQGMILVAQAFESFAVAAPIEITLSSEMMGAWVEAARSSPGVPASEPQMIAPARRVLACFPLSTEITARYTPDHLRLYYHYLGFSEAAAEALSRLFNSNGADQDCVGQIEYLAGEINHNTYFQNRVEAVLESGLLDLRYFAERSGFAATGSDAAVHYLLIGELLGMPPSVQFDPVYYGLRYVDVGDGGLNLLLHYVENGRAEGRLPLPPSPPFVIRPEHFDPERENIIVAVHETSRTGAPILGWNVARRLAKTYNVFAVLLGGGALTEEFAALSAGMLGPFDVDCRNPIDAEYGLRPLFRGREFRYAIVNSIESRSIIEACAKACVPTMLLVHEFSTYVHPRTSLTRAYDLADELVFPAPLVAASAVETHPLLANRSWHVAPQGMSVVPAEMSAQRPQAPPELAALKRAKARGALIVLGAGSVGLRKGVDMFLAVAASVQQRELTRPVHFVWVGSGYRPEEDMAYSVYLKEQIKRSDLEEHVTFIDEVSDLEPIYALVGVMLLTSRLDPLPNVSIDAAHRAIPIVCFKNASGMADLLLADAETATGVVGYLDTRGAADLIVRLSADEPARLRVAAATKRLARSIFNMDSYVQRLDTLGRASAERVTERRAAVERRRALPTVWFDAEWYAQKASAGADYADFLARGADAGRLPSALVAQMMQAFRPSEPFTLLLYNALVEASEGWPEVVPERALSLLITLYAPEWHAKVAAPLDGFIAYLRDGVLAGVSPGPLFQTDVYRREVAGSDLPPLGRDESAVMHWLLHGCAARVVPTDRFDELFYRRTNPDIGESPTWGFAHFLEHGLQEGEGRRPKSVHAFWKATESEDGALDSRSAFYRYWHELDFPRDAPAEENVIPAVARHRMEEVMGSDALAEIFDAAQAIEPDVGEIASFRLLCLPPFHDGMTAVHAEARRRIPATHYDSVVCVPWIRTGGADRVAALLAKALLRVRPDERVLILRTDHAHFERPDWLPAEADCVDISDLKARVTHLEAQTLLRVILRGLTAKRVFNVNSNLCWTTMRDHGVNLAATLQTYAYMFCWDQTADGLRVGYPLEFYPETAGTMTAFLTDTVYLRDQLKAMYRLPTAVSRRILPIFTPAQGPMHTPSTTRLVGDAVRGDRPLVLWAGRLDRQKRFDLVQEIARLMPDVEFRCWGEALLDAPPDLSALPPNLTMQGSFDSLDDLPLDEAGAWLFTSSWEGMPTLLLDLATRGVAVVASAVGGVPELIGADTGWPVRPDTGPEDYVAALREALSSPQKAIRRAEALRRRAHVRYSQDGYDAALEALLNAEEIR